ncbi:hypothetical protein [Sphingobacterium bovistauri]|uniref:Uncharacterized protein n=1 Tax=Sphingobacterium bovistauri TaxID=2781959 RepID=A0ABS7Z1A5_9SPHI|nr:hypothetical protein [Sphingobacterium bovistauri]MCA5003953.1 hypothetical protein [Sphingobacterium bovistauri]
MKSAHQIAFLNLVFIIINSFWIIIIDTKKIYGFSIYDTFFNNWSYLTPHIDTFNIWKIITVTLALTAVLYCLVLKREYDEDLPLAQKIEKSGNWMILNQLLLGLSMVLKLNNYLVLAYLFTIGTFYSLVKLNYIFKIRDDKNPSFVHVFTRTSLGFYSGWYVYLLGFNGIPTLGRLLKQPSDQPLFFYLSLLFVISSFSYILYKAVLCNLPAILVGYSAGILGAYYYNINSNKEDIYHLIMRYTFLIALIITIVTVLYLIFKRRKILMALE